MTADCTSSNRAIVEPPARREWVRRMDLGWLKLRRRIKHRLGVLDPLRLDVYLGYAGAERAVVRGRALENELPKRPAPEDTLVDNLRRSLRQLESDEVPELILELTFAGQTLELKTDDEGYFHADFVLEQPLAPGWAPVGVQVRKGEFELSEGVVGEGRVLVPSPNARFGVISDIDDTILQSHVRNRWRQARVTLLGNAITRLSYDGTSELYQGLRSAGHDAPFFYVSRSAWNIHPVLEHFIEHQGLPMGPLILRDVGIFTDREARRGHKKREIDRILRIYPKLSFVLIGDSGQRDALIYSDIASENPGRVLAILIRNVSPEPRRRQVDRVLRERCSSVPWCIFGDSREAIGLCRRHAIWQSPGN